MKKEEAALCASAFSTCSAVKNSLLFGKDLQVRCTVNFGATSMIGIDLRDPGFWLALMVGVLSVGALVCWLITGARKSRRRR
jgi:hypothetical protein